MAAPWAGARSASAARSPAALEPARAFVGQPLTLTLHPDGEVEYVSLPKGEGEAASFGGLAPIVIERAGTYRIGLEKPVWVDVSAGGEAAKAVRFGHGPDCSGIAKVVEFQLEAGPHVIEISGASEPSVGILVERMS